MIYYVPERFTNRTALYSWWMKCLQSINFDWKCWSKTLIRMFRLFVWVFVCFFHSLYEERGISKWRIRGGRAKLGCVFNAKGTSVCFHKTTVGVGGWSLHRTVKYCRRPAIVYRTASIYIYIYTHTNAITRVGSLYIKRSRQSPIQTSSIQLLLCR